MAPPSHSARGPEDEAWLATAQDLSSRHAATPELSRAMLTRYIAELHALVQTMPRSIDEAYKLIPERTLTKLSGGRMGAMMAGDFAWAPASGDDGAWALAIGGQFRAYDDELLRLVPSDSGPKRNADAWYCEPADAYVVPRRRPNRPIGGPGHNNSFARRALIHHRVFPGRFRGDTVEVTVIDDLSPTAAVSHFYRLGGAGFEAASLHCAVREEGGQRRFRAVRQDCADAGARVAAQVASAFGEGCFAVVWPELTITPALRERAARSIAAKAFDAASVRPRLWVMGSWHEDVDGTTVNRTHVLDRNGRSRHVYDKMSRYHTADLGFEDIAIGRHVPVIVSDEAIVSLAICKDFCMNDSDAPIRRLPVDLVLVPSFGGETTIAEHLRASRDIRVWSGGASFVMQQMSDEGADPPEIAEGEAVVPSRSALALVPGKDGLQRKPTTQGWIVCDVQLR